MKTGISVCMLTIVMVAAAFGSTEVVKRQVNNGVDLYLRNEHHAPVTVVATLELTNARARYAKSNFVVPAKSESIFASIRQVTAGVAWRYRFNYRYVLGDSSAKHDRTARYALPFEIGKTVKVGQAFNGQYSHFGKSRFAVDFPLPEGTPIYPSRPGIVVAVESGFSIGGRDRSLRDKANYVYILHADKTIGRYLHLMRGQVFVKPGQRVARKTKLGRSGNTGWSTEPHLHFDISIPADANSLRTMRFEFSTRTGKRFVPKRGQVIRVDW